MIRNDIIFFDFETGSKNPETTQAIQLAAVCIDVKNLKIRKDSEFESLIKPYLDDEEAIAAGLDPLEDEALAVNGKTREELAEAPLEKQVFESFGEYTKRFAKKSGDHWSFPFRSGFRNRDFDDIIINRISKNYGMWDDKRGACKYFHPMGNIDLFQEVNMMFCNKKLNSGNSMSMDSLRDFFGLSKDGAHDALVDVIQGAEILVQFLKLFKKIEPKINFKRK